MIVLAIDASTYVGTAAVFDDDRLLASGEAAMRGKDTERLFPLVLDVLHQAGCDLRRIGELVCGAGPGSFTSLRIAASIAKGMAVGLGIGIRPVPSLGLIVAGTAGGASARNCLAALDALRGEFYVQSFAFEGQTIRPLSDPFLAPGTELEALAHRNDADLIGPGIGGNAGPHARGAMRLARMPLVDLSTWEPDYGRKAEAQSRWEAAHGRSMPV